MKEDPKQSNTVTHTADTRNPEWDNYAPEGHGQTDEQIRADLHQKLGKLTEQHASAVSISVEDGVVTLSGRVGRDAQQKVLEFVRSVPSVKDVRDQLQVEG